MEVTRVEESGPLEINQGIKLDQPGKSRCIYDPRVECTAPKLHLKICRSCPRASNYVSQHVVKSIFERVKALAIMLLNNIGGGPQSAGSSSSGSTGSGGTGGSGGGGGAGGGGS